MKSFCLILVACALMSTNAISQNFAHIHTAKLMSIMPAYRLAKMEMEKFTLAKENEFREMEKLLQQKVLKYQSDNTELTELQASQIEKEVVEMQNRLLEFKTSSEKEIEKREEELTTPIFDKVGKAIIKVAAEQGYDYVIDESVGSVIVVPKSRDLMDLVKRELGI